MKSLSVVVVVVVLLLNVSRYTPISALVPMSTPKTHQPHYTVMRMEKIPLLRRFRLRKKTLESPPPSLAVGSRLPNIDVEKLNTSPEGGDGEKWTSLSLLDALGDGMSILMVCMMPSTKTCESIHFPGYREASPKLEKLGIRKIAMVTSKTSLTNPEFTITTSSGMMNGSSENKTPLVPTSPTDITLLAYSADDANLVKDLGFTKEMGSGIKSNRFVLVLENGIVIKVLREEGVGDCTVASALRIVECLTPPPNSLINNNPEAIEIDYRIIIGAGAILFIFLYTLLASILMEYNVSLPSLFRFDLSWLFHSSAQVKDDASSFQLLRDYL